MNPILTNVIDKLLDEGIEITLKKENGIIKYDLNTGMKSGMIISDGGYDTIRCEGRYERDTIVDTYRAVLWEVKLCLCGRDFMNYYWEKLLIKEGLLTKTITTQVSYA